MRVLAITGNASLVVALGSMMRDWEVVTVRNAEEAASAGSDSAVALIDLGDTDAGLEVADRLYSVGITIPAVVIGDRLVEGQRASILIRPFSLEDLSVAVREASERVFDEPPAPQPVPQRAPEPAAAPTPREPKPPAATWKAPQPQAPPASGPRAEPAASHGGATTAPRPPQRKPEEKPRPLTVVPPPEKTLERAVERQPTPQAPEAPRPAEPQPEQRPEPPVAAPTPKPIPQAAPPRPQLPVDPSPEPAQAPPVAKPPPPAEPAPRPVQAPAASAAEASGGSAATAPQQAPITEPAGRWRLRRKPAVQPDELEPPVVRRLKATASQLHNLNSLIDELPVLVDLREMADALAGEIEALFSAPVASVFIRGDDGYHAVAHRGLSRVESGMIVPETQPLFSDVLRTREGILIQPVDLAQGLVAGIGGARTEAMMAAPAVLHGECFAIIVVGGDRFGETDLDRLSDLATEAAPGLAVAHLIKQIRDRT